MTNSNHFSREDILELRRQMKDWNEIGKLLGIGKRKLMPLIDEWGIPRSWAIDKESLQEYVDNKYSDEEIAQEWGYGATRDSIAKSRSRFGILRTDNAPPRPTSPERLKKIEALLDDGYSFHAIRGMLGVNHRTLQKHFPGRQYTQEQKIEAMLMGQKMARLERVL